MSIVVVCPHCETRFTLQPEMAGKSMRCPNLECRQVFTVVPLPNRETAPEPTKPVKPKKKPSAGVGEQVEILDAQLAPVPPRRDKPRPPKPADTFEVVDAAVVSPANVKEVVWTGSDPLPPVRGAPPAPPVVDEVDDDLPVLRRRKKKSKKGNGGRAKILIGGLVAILVVGFFAARQILVQEGQAEEKLAAQAKEAYGKSDFAAAGKDYEKLAAEYPNSPDNGKYKFLSDMARTYSAVRAVTNREDPEPALKKYREFLDANKASPFAKPKTGYGVDVLQAGKKIGEDMAGYVEDRVKAFKADRTRADELAKADAMIATTRDLGPQLDPFRGPDDAPPFDGVYKQLDAAAAEMKFERNRLAVFEKVRGLLAAPSDKVIEQANALLAENKLDGDAEAQDMVLKAKVALQGLVKYEDMPNAPRKPPESSAASLLFVAPVGVTKPAVKLPVDDPGASVFLAVARGVLYALDEDTGELLWAARVGTDVFDPPAVARVDLGEGPKELAVVTSNVAGKPGITITELRTGTALWFQPLLAPAAGPAVIYGTRAFVPIRDELGSVFEFDLTNGNQIGRITLTQPIGPAALRPGTGLLYVPADARRVYVVDVGGKDDDGRRLPPKCVQVITTGHLAGTLRTPPIILGPAGDAPADRWMVLSQADGPTSMKLRSFPIAQSQPADGGPAATEVPAEASSELSVPGWAWFPPVTDGERLAIVTDAGQLRLFGVNQPGNADRAMFPLPHPALPAAADGAPVPGFVVPAEEAAFWVLAGGSLQKVRLSLIPARGLEVVPASRAVALGVPTQAAQMNLRRDAACFVVRSGGGSGFRAALVSLKDGETRWQRQLGVAAAAPPVPHGDGVLMIDEDGGASLVPPTVGTVAAGATKSAEPGWVVASSLDGVTGPTQVAVSADGKVVHTVTPTGVAPAAKFVIRKIVDGKVERTGTVAAPAALAGPPVAFEKGLLLPAADGFVYRVIPGDGKLNPDTLRPGLRWLEDRRNPDAVCFITVLPDDSFVTSDGGRLLAKWTWAGRDMTPGNAGWEVRERIAVPPLVLPAAGGGTAARLLVADVTGSVWMYEMTKSGPPVRRWRSGGASPVPIGRPTSSLSPGTDASGRAVVSYVVEGRSAVCFAPDKDVPLWVAKTGDDTGSSLVGHPRPIDDGRWLIADLSGKVQALDGATGKPAAAGEVALPGVVPSATGSQIDKSRMLIPLSDGSAVVVPVGDGGK